MNSKKQTQVLFCCMGNICRSPTAHGVFRQLVMDSGLQDQIAIDSAGTHAYHVGNPPDNRAQATAQRRGIDLADLRARQVSQADFIQHDYVLVMDQANYQDLMSICPAESQHKIRLFLDFAADWQENEVPDPYYGGPRGFERVFDMIEAASRGLLADIQQQL